MSKLSEAELTTAAKFTALNIENMISLIETYDRSKLSILSRVLATSGRPFANIANVPAQRL